MTTPPRPELAGEIQARLDRLADRLRSLRHRIDDPELPAPQREADLYAYDEALVSAADILDVPVPAAARDELSPEHRAEIEAGLAEVGVDVKGEVQAGSEDGTGAEVASTGDSSEGDSSS